jgi:hypothetical protein
VQWLFLDMVRRVVGDKFHIPNDPSGWVSWQYRLVVAVGIGLVALSAHLLCRWRNRAGTRCARCCPAR